ncbi:hypothetical protein EUGRSUZ_B01743 [Eucalyptus grandis]|uniref:Uncharacterized protein n=2 Tax=Eucalyptus grandis TaxID=71139 RepID=A0ACC3LSD4_EUCGR|nr:hypothetical protein EUGRSUZ_B01743 [Eucalyptus grandis]
MEIELPKFNYPNCRNYACDGQCLLRDTDFHGHCDFCDDTDHHAGSFVCVVPNYDHGLISAALRYLRRKPLNISITVIR